MDNAKLNDIRRQGAGRSWRRVQRAAGAHRRPARPLQGASRGRPDDRGRAGEKTGIAERYASEWLSHQAASSYLSYDPATGRFTLPPEQAMVLAEADSPVYLQGAFDLATVMMENQSLVEPAFRTGKGVGWGDQSQCLFCTVGASSGRPITTVL